MFVLCTHGNIYFHKMTGKCILKSYQRDKKILQIYTKERFENIKGVIIARKSKKDKQHNGDTKKDKKTNNDLQDYLMGDITVQLINWEEK